MVRHRLQAPATVQKIQHIVHVVNALLWVSALYLYFVSIYNKPHMETEARDGDMNLHCRWVLSL